MTGKFYDTKEYIAALTRRAMIEYSKDAGLPDVIGAQEYGQVIQASYAAVRGYADPNKGSIPSIPTIGWISWHAKTSMDEVIWDISEIQGKNPFKREGVDEPFKLSDLERVKRLIDDPSTPLEKLTELNHRIAFALHKRVNGVVEKPIYLPAMNTDEDNDVDVPKESKKNAKEKTPKYDIAKASMG